MCNAHIVAGDDRVDAIEQALRDPGPVLVIGIGEDLPLRQRQGSRPGSVFSIPPRSPAACDRRAVTDTHYARRSACCRSEIRPCDRPRQRREEACRPDSSGRNRAISRWVRRALPPQARQTSPGARARSSLPLLLPALEFAAKGPIAQGLAHDGGTGNLILARGRLDFGSHIGRHLDGQSL